MANKHKYENSTLTELTDELEALKKLRNLGTIDESKIDDEISYIEEVIAIKLSGDDNYQEQFLIE